MSKNTNINGFRRINIDAYDPENYQDDEPDNQTDQTGPNETEILNLLNSKKNVDALRMVLANSPINTKQQNIKVSNYASINNFQINFKYKNQQQ
jgi:ERCC4-related helicase